MRREPYIEDADADPTIAVADWKENVESVLEHVDEQLADHGLEVVMFETGSDEYQWRIEKRVLQNVGLDYGEVAG